MLRSNSFVHLLWVVGGGFIREPWELQVVDPSGLSFFDPAEGETPGETLTDSYEQMDMNSEQTLRH